jgi:DNA-directed RNA polymerase subunit RPC12/RpoP
MSWLSTHCKHGEPVGRQCKECLTEVAKKKTEELNACPFCGGKAVFSINKSKQIMIQHYPEAGVCCPARYDQYCDNFEQGKKWWNTRAFYPAVG